VLHETQSPVTGGMVGAPRHGMTDHTFDCIDLAQLDTATGGWNPIKTIVHKAHQAYDKVKSGVESGVKYLEQHPQIWKPQPPLY
jgi:hypothetical protein